MQKKKGGGLQCEAMGPKKKITLYRTQTPDHLHLMIDCSLIAYFTELTKELMAGISIIWTMC